MFIFLSHVFFLIWLHILERRKRAVVYLVPKCQRGFPGGTSGKEPACQCRRHKRCGFYPWVRKIPWSREWQPTPVFLPGESHRGAWRATVQRVQQSWTWLNQLSTAQHKLQICVISHNCKRRFGKNPKKSYGTISKLKSMKVTQLCLTLCDPIDCSLSGSCPPGSSLHGILQARILKWVAIPFPGDRPNPGIEPGSLSLQADSLPSESPGKPYIFTTK